MFKRSRSQKAAAQAKELAQSFDKDAVAASVSSFASSAAQMATEAAQKAGVLADQAKEWAAPRAEQAWKETVKVAAPKIEAASEAVRPKVDAAHDKLVSDYLPRVQKAMQDASEAASADVPLRDRAEKVAKVTSKALSEPTKKGHPVLKGLGFTLLAAVLGVAGYVLWRRSQPVEDPWAEEYWADLEAKTEKVDFETEAVEAEERAEEEVANMELKDPEVEAK
ncbi:hypothetical protein BK816_00060 [Boudabousia tangfeifanii]|uniref:Uncharacterized protein n=1 Tax=Boudabousia tangfeifanii TaxID=1912795 RepID=A0A1D9MHW0_9ACTO|nr:hypothetical protein [Boudabousia tangfeifanii]AOZ71877.1 hypothetical protein BK816_00060 [Boudabousia tangfeifanii]